MINDGRYLHVDGEVRQVLRFDFHHETALKEASFAAHNKSGELLIYWFGQLAEKQPDCFHISIDERSEQVKTKEASTFTDLELCQAPEGGILLTGKKNNALIVYRFKSMDQGKRKFRDTLQIEFDNEFGFPHTRIIPTRNIPNSHPDHIEGEISISRILENTGFEIMESQGTGRLNGNGKEIRTDNCKKWSNDELHATMFDLWSMEPTKIGWNVWAFMAGEHVESPIQGIMFDFKKSDRFQRQGLAVFEGAVRRIAPVAPGNHEDWTNRLKLFITMHELGHVLNLPHSDNRSQSTPWIDMKDDPGACSFMSFPPSFANGYEGFFRKFDYNFSPEELRFIRHAPDEFVQMGRSAWFVQNAFQVNVERRVNDLTLSIEAGCEGYVFEYLEPVLIEYTLKNLTAVRKHLGKYLTQEYGELALSPDCLTVFIKKEGGSINIVDNGIREFSDRSKYEIAPFGEIQGSVFAALGSDGNWVMKDPGTYFVEAILHLEEGDLVSNRLSITIESPALENKEKEEQLAEEILTPEMSRVLQLDGYRIKRGDHFNVQLRKISNELSYKRIAIHANIAIAMPLRKHFNYIDYKEQAIRQLKPKKKEALYFFRKAFEDPEKAKITLGKTDYNYYLKIYRELQSELQVQFT